jgi:hypothetical protein
MRRNGKRGSKSEKGRAGDVFSFGQASSWAFNE